MDVKYIIDTNKMEIIDSKTGEVLQNLEENYEFWALEHLNDGRIRKLRILYTDMGFISPASSEVMLLGDIDSDGDIDVSDLSKLSDYEAPVFAYDKLGNKLDVEIKPDKLITSTQVTTPSKVVPVEAVVTGNAPEGHSVGNLTLTPSEVKLYGETTALESYDKLQVQVDLYQLDDNNELIVKLDKPENIHKMDTDTIKVKVTFEETQTKVLENISVDFKNLDAKYSVKAKSLSDAVINLTLKGSTTKLNSISADDVKVWIDLLGYTPGEYQVPITVESITGVLIDPSRAKVNVIITE